MPALSLPPCFVSVRRLSLEEISRMAVNPFYVRHSCPRCKRPITFGPRCSVCRTLYHNYCAKRRPTCCDRPLPISPSESRCPRCRHTVKYGPQCPICHIKYHRFCVSPYDKCCQLILCEPKWQADECGKCLQLVAFGPKCPLCVTVYHVDCVRGRFECCGVNFGQDSSVKYECGKCRKKLSLGAPMCTVCGRLTHGHCLSKSRRCCGRRFPLEIYLIPSYKHLAMYYRQLERREAVVAKMGLKGASQVDKCLGCRSRKRKSVSSQTQSEVEVEVKTEEVEVAESPPPLLEREESPEPTSTQLAMPDIVDSEDSLRSLFDFLYKMARRFPPQLQAQVKVELFKVVTEAEMRCSLSQ